MSRTRFAGMFYFLFAGLFSVQFISFVKVQNAYAGAVSQPNIETEIDNSQKELPTPNDLSAAIEKYLSYIPSQSLKCVVEKTKEDLMVKEYSGLKSVNVENGFVKKNKTLLEKSPCLLQLAQNFYSIIGDLNPPSPLEAPHTNLNHKTFERQKKVRASIFSKLGMEGLDHMQPGWLWKMGLAFSSHDSNLAMNLIGLCGHDDTANSITTLGNDSTELNCPGRTSSMFVPESLGAGITISNDLKWKIARLQAPSKGGTVIPAKYYHVIGAARVGCKVSQCGLSSNLNAKVQEQIGALYRGIALCNSIRSHIKKVNIYADHDYKIAVEQGRLVDSKENYWKAVDSIDNRKYYKEAIELYLGSHFIYGNNVVCSDIQKPTGLSLKKGINNCTNSSLERCDAAKDIIASWLVDFEWTREQHRVGAKFGFEACKEPKSEQEIEVLACRSLQNLSGPF